MRKILLVIEDYHERTYLQTMLKKVGWDVVGLSTELGLGEQILSFAPDVILLSQDVRKSKGMEIAKGVKKRDGYPKIVLLGSKAFTKADLEAHNVDLFLMSPVNNRLLFEFLEKAGGFSAKASLLKIRNMRYPLEKMSEEQVKVLKSRSETVEPELVTEKTTFDENAERKKRNENFLKKLEIKSKSTHFKAQEIQSYTEKILADGYSEEDKKLDEEKKEFVKALFQASKKK